MQDDSEGSSLKKKKVEGKAKGKTIEDFFGKRDVTKHEISEDEEDKGSNSSREGREAHQQKGFVYFIQILCFVYHTRGQLFEINNIVS